MLKMSGYSDYHEPYHPDSYYYFEKCCPLVVEPLTYIALLSFIALAVYLLNEQIQMSMLMMARKKRQLNWFLIGKIH